MFLNSESGSTDNQLWSANDPELFRLLGDELLRTLGFDRAEVEELHRNAARNASDLHDELMNLAKFNDLHYYKKLAELLGLPFIRHIDPDRIIIRDQKIGTLLRAKIAPSILLYREREGKSSIIVAPRHSLLREFVVHLCRYPGLRKRIRIASQSELKRALEDCGRTCFTDHATNLLVLKRPEYSARTVANAWQGGLFGALIVALPFSWSSYPIESALLLHGISSIFFLACIYLRISATTNEPALGYCKLDSIDWRYAPNYTVLVPLYREGEVVDDLLKALSMIVWPRSKFEVKLICEANDEETLNAIRKSRSLPYFQIVTVPPSHPRTKPKALNYALQSSTGDLVAVYDAEDRPHPHQLIEAWQKFTGSDSNLACVQAPLVIANFRQNALTGLFAFEYAALFRGILPWLANNNRIFPLGGTSNHFRRDILEKVGGWDPYNVTEDADMGLRLVRHGYRISTISRPTLEDAPDNFLDWVKQRTRWYKGWFQTWLVHNRSPAALYRDIGTPSFWLAQILFCGMIVSALVHPLYLFTISKLLFRCLSGATMSVTDLVLAVIDASNVVLGYSAFLFLGYRTLIAQEKKGFVAVVLRTPLYWLGISLAAWRAVLQIVCKPFLWEKTPHKRHYRGPSSD